MTHYPALHAGVAALCSLESALRSQSRAHSPGIGALREPRIIRDALEAVRKIGLSGLTTSISSGTVRVQVVDQDLPDVQMGERGYGILLR